MATPHAGYHVTTPRKLARYRETGAILPPVRYWRSEHAARDWMRRVSRSVVVRFDVTGEAHPLPDHRPRGMAWWTPDLVRAWEVL